MIKHFEERTGWKHDKDQLKNRYRQLKIFYSAMTVLQRSTRGGRAGGGYKARKHIWDHFIHVRLRLPALPFRISVLYGTTYDLMKANACRCYMNKN